MSVYTKKTWLAHNMPGAVLDKTNTFHLLVSLKSADTQKRKFRCQPIQKTLRIKEYSYLFDQEDARGRAAPTNILHLFVPLMAIYVQKIQVRHLSIPEILRVKISQIWLAKSAFTMG